MPSSTFSRRDWLAAAAAAVGALVIRPADALANASANARANARALAKTPITIYKSPTCGCCTKWVDHARAAGFVATVHDTEGMDAIKKRNGVPANLQSCHTALVGGYVIEGHVPAGDVLRLLREKPAAVRGLAVPGMPAGSPGMEIPGGPVDRYDVVAFHRDGSTKVFAKH